MPLDFDEELAVLCPHPDYINLRAATCELVALVALVESI